VSTWPDTAGLEAEVNRLRPIPIPLKGQCLRIAMAQVLRVPVDQVPPRLQGQPLTEWLARVTLEHGTYFELVTAKKLPPATGPWIAVVATETPGERHAVAMIGRTSYDPTCPGAAYGALGGLVPK
jgi:hypothetical protein